MPSRFAETGRVARIPGLEENPSCLPSRVLSGFFRMCSPSSTAATEVPILEPGQSFNNDTFEIERYLGSGAFAEVYRIKHRFLGRQAIKVFKTPGATLEDIETDLEEACLLSRIGHPNIVRVYDANVMETPDGSVGYFTMTYVSGGSLYDFWQGFGAKLMPVETAVDVIRQTCRGLAVAHAEEPPIVHRDVKPQNVLIGYGNKGLHVRLSDFGLAKHVNPMTLLVSAQGTLGFKPPEAFGNMDSCAADVWAIGATLYLLLTDQMPFPALDERDLGDGRHFLRPLRPASVFNIGVDSALEGILLRCLAAEPRDRYPDAIEVLKDLDRWKPGAAPVELAMVSRDDLPAKPHMGPVDEQAPPSSRAAGELVERAIRKSQEPGSLTEAADLLEQAIGQDSSLGERYESRLRLWRRGISM
jgi:eukaryotic-like serine/threonine-protein kinase